MTASKSTLELNPPCSSTTAYTARTSSYNFTVPMSAWPRITAARSFVSDCAEAEP